MLGRGVSSADAAQPGSLPAPWAVSSFVHTRCKALGCHLLTVLLSIQFSDFTLFSLTPVP